MDFETDDPILDALLDEAVGGRRPPDLTARILHTWGVQKNGAGSLQENASPPLPSVPLDLTTAPPAPPPIMPGINTALADGWAEGVIRSKSALSKRERRAEPISAVLTISAAAAIVGLGLTIGLVTWLRPAARPVGPRPGDVAAHPATGEKPVEPNRVASAPAPHPSPRVSLSPVRERRPATPQLAEQTPTEPSPPSTPTDLPSPDRTAETAKPVEPVRVASTPKLRAAPSTDAQVITFVNAELTRVWKDTGVKPTVAISDTDWCERVFQRVLGRTPTSEELKRLTDDRATNRREKLIDRLLTQSTYGEEFAQHWSAVLTNILLGKNGGRGGSLASRDELQEYFATALRANKSYAQIARELLTATGSAKSGAEQHNPAVNFLLDGWDNSAITATARISRVLLGHQLQCARCHSHPTQQWSQDQFWALNACLRSLRVEKTGDTARLVDSDETGIVEIAFKTSDGATKSVRPAFLDGADITSFDSATRRQELARLVIDSDDFCLATVNRIWAQLLDYGFNRPVDDLGPHSSPAAPAVLDRLASEFAAHQFDLKHVIRWAVLSDPFARSSELRDLASKDMPEEGQPALFSRFYDRPLQIAPAFDALVQTNRIRATASSRSEVERARIDWLMQANRTPAGKAVPPNVTAVMPNSGDPRRLPASGDPTGLVKKLAASKMPFGRQVEHLFLAALDRPPTQREQQAAQQLSRSNRGNASAALEDIWWALQNSTECIVDR